MVGDPFAHEDDLPENRPGLIFRLPDDKFFLTLGKDVEGGAEGDQQSKAAADDEFEAEAEFHGIFDFPEPAGDPLQMEPSVSRRKKLKITHELKLSSSAADARQRPESHTPVCEQADNKADAALLESFLQISFSFLRYT
jgi:hypothetical protein